jgi:hypothetical protein
VCGGGDAGQVGIGVGCAVAVGVAGEGLGDDGVEVGIAAVQEETREWAILQLGLDALGAEGERVEIRLVGILSDAGRVAEELLQRACVDRFELMVEGVVEVAELEDQLLATDVLVDANVVGARPLGTGRGDVILGDVGGIAGLL